MKPRLNAIRLVTITLVSAMLIAVAAFGQMRLNYLKGMRDFVYGSPTTPCLKACVCWMESDGGINASCTVIVQYKDGVWKAR